jgi:UDP-4-amino-4,6-dideoxy-N-acetyl-beta-L-altrosamine transaminase
VRNIPYGRQDISKEDISEVTAILQSNWLTQGPAIEKFEQSVADYCGAKYAVAVANATAALHIACLAAGLGKGDMLWTSPNTFVASANCGIYCGANVDFVDINPKTYNLSITELEKKLVYSNEKPKIVIPVHFAGQACEMDKLYNLAKQYNFTIIEDASHAISGEYKDEKIGSCAYSDMTVFSFHPVKIITTGEGGMVLTNKKDLYEKLVLLRSHGITRNESLMIGESDGPWYYQQIDLGFNYRMTDIQAILGTSQLKRIDNFSQRRRCLAEKYNDVLRELPVILPYQHPDTSSSWHLYVIVIKTELCVKTRKQIFEELRQAGIGVNVHYIPVHTQPFYQKIGFCYGDFPIAEEYYENAISIPLHYGLTDEEQNYIIDKLYTIIR